MLYLCILGLVITYGKKDLNGRVFYNDTYTYDAAGKTTTYTYTALGKVATVTDSMNHRQEYTYDERGLNTSVRDANNGLSNVQYDALGNITALSGPLGGTTNYAYDAMGRLIAETTSSGGTITYGYNELNVRTQLTNARGQKRKYFYDGAGRITGYVGQEDSVSYTYDANGNVLTVTDRNGTIKREYDALNRVTRYTDTYGKTVCYEYDAVGNLTRLVYPDNTSVVYGYDANNNLVSVTDWANRVTAYTYDVNNRLIGVTKPDGSVTTTVYDAKQRVVSTVEKTPGGAVISGFEYTYDTLSRVVEEKHLAEQTKLCYTYDSLNRVTSRIVKNEQDAVIASENYTYDAAGNIVEAPDSCFLYDVNNRLTVFNGNAVNYDLDGNMLSNGVQSFSYDSANRLVSAGGHTYTYNAADVRIRNLCADEDTTYTYNTNCKLSQLLTKTTNGVTTKYVYGAGLIGEETDNAFKTYHFDYRGSTVAITDAAGNITDTFAYDTYGKLISRTGTSDVIFCYNGRDGVITDRNGLYYMRARYYSPEMRRFVNADILHGAISDSTSLNRYAYVNGNPVSFVDPFGLAKWLETALKITAGVAVIAGLAVATAVTGGAAAVVTGAALAGAAISGTASVVSGTLAGDSVDEIATSFMVGTVAGAASGALTASSAPGLAVAAGNLAIDVGEYMVEESIDGDDEQMTVGGVVSTAAFSLAPALLPKFDFKAKKFVKEPLDAGWLHKGSAYYKESARHNLLVKEYSKRANKKYANKQISRSLAKHNEFISKHWDLYLRGLVFDEIKSSFYEPYQQEFGQRIDNQFALKNRK